jgi:hypothetical protein
MFHGDGRRHFEGFVTLGHVAFQFAVVIMVVVMDHMHVTVEAKLVVPTSTDREDKNGRQGLETDKHGGEAI